jgi:curved DNA-binding protein CbpA
MKDYFIGCKTEEEAKKLYRTLSKKFHPDAGGDAKKMAELNEQYEKFKPQPPKGNGYTYEDLKRAWDGKEKPKTEKTNYFYDEFSQFYSKKSAEEAYSKRHEYQQRHTENVYGSSPFGKASSSEQLLINQLRARLDTMSQAYHQEKHSKEVALENLQVMNAKYEGLNKWSIEQLKIEKELRKARDELQSQFTTLQKAKDELNKTVSDLLKDLKRVDKERELAIIDKLTMWQFLKDKINRWLND